MGNSASTTRNEQATTTSKATNSNITSYSQQSQHKQTGIVRTKEQKPSQELKSGGPTQQKSSSQRLRQISTWSLGSLSGRLNWSFTGAGTRGSLRNRNKSTRKSLTALQQRRSKTQWHKPLTNVIFSTHFKEASRNNQFHLERLVAKGAFGVVFKVINKQYTQELENITKTNGRPAPVYALKVLKKSKILEENSVQQIKDEADIQKLCGHHPFIVQQVDLWQNRRNLHILSEFIPNGELFSKLTHFSLDLTRVYLAEIALATDFLHHAGVIYRDIKPENILLTADFHIKLTDFGLSKWLRLGATTRTLCGTFQYMAPEILRYEPYGHAVDWWSIGILLCQMLTHASPDIREIVDVTLPNQDNVDRATPLLPSKDMKSATFDFIQAESKSNALKSEHFFPPEFENLPHEAKDVLKRLLEVDPKQRLRSVMSLQKIAMYKNFQIDSKHLLTLHPKDMIDPEDLLLFTEHSEESNENSTIIKEFQDF